MPSSLTRRVVAGAIAGIAAVAIVGPAATSFADSATSGTSASPTAISPTSGKPVTRLAGNDRIGTAIAISQQEFPNGGAGAVILTASYDFADAMSAGPLGKVLNAPLLLTTPGSLAPATLTEIQRVLAAGSPPPDATTTTTTANPTTTTTTASTTTSTTTGASAAAVAASPVVTTCPTPVASSPSPAPPTAAGGTVYIIGGFAAIAQEVDTQLRAAGYNVVRIAGDNRFATSVDVAQCEGSPTTVFLATGDIFADALSAGPAAAHVQGGGSVLLTDGKVMPPAVSQYLTTLTNPTVYAIGAAAAIADPQATAVFGGDRFATSALVASRFFTAPTVVGIATGADFPDALAGGAFMGVEGGPVLMSDPRVLPSAVGLYLAENQTSIGQAFLFGGTGALSNAIATTVSHLINNQP